MFTTIKGKALNKAIRGALEKYNAYRLNYSPIIVRNVSEVCCDVVYLYSDASEIDESNIEKCTNGIMNGTIRISYEDTNERGLFIENSYRVFGIRFSVSSYDSTNNEFSIIIESPNINL